MFLQRTEMIIYSEKDAAESDLVHKIIFYVMVEWFKIYIIIIKIRSAGKDLKS